MWAVSKLCSTEKQAACHISGLGQRLSAQWAAQHSRWALCQPEGQPEGQLEGRPEEQSEGQPEGQPEGHPVILSCTSGY